MLPGMQRTVTVALPDEAHQQLVALAEREYRRTKDQAGILLVGAIEAEYRRRHKRRLPSELAEASAR
jgi:hypothetical protein